MIMLYWIDLSKSSFIVDEMGSRKALIRPSHHKDGQWYAEIQMDSLFDYYTDYETFNTRDDAMSWVKDSLKNADFKIVNPKFVLLK